MRMIERWFPCAEVSDASGSGWGSGKSEKALFIWFAARPLAQARAAVITSLLPWPDEPAEQRRLQDLVRAAMTGRDAAHAELVIEIQRQYPGGASMLDPFSGRAMIPLEAARLGVKAWGIDYSPVATLAGTLLADYPLRDWSAEPELPFGQSAGLIDDRLVNDVGRMVNEIGRRHADEMAPFYPTHRGAQPWGYLWAMTLPCQECGRRFPLTGSLLLRQPLPMKNDPGQSYRIDVDVESSTFQAVVHEGQPNGSPTLVSLLRGGKAVRGKAAICPFCNHVHPKDVHTRLAQEGLAEDVLLIAADPDESVGKAFRRPTEAEIRAAESAKLALASERDFGPGLPAIPSEVIPLGNFDTVRPSMYGARTYGDLCNPRQTLSFVRLARAVQSVGIELSSAGLSPEYVAALTGYASSVLARKLRLSTRAVTLRQHLSRTSNNVQTSDMFRNEASIAFSHDYFEGGLGDGPGSWESVKGSTLAVLRNHRGSRGSRPALIRQGTATALPLASGVVDVVVTDPPYDDMIDYSDASDLFYVWLKRALVSTHPEFGITADPRGVQEKGEEIIVKRGGGAVNDHRTREFYDTMLARAFAEARRVVREDGVVTIVFGHGDPVVWHRLLGAVTAGGLCLTGSWPARTEAGGKAGSANIVTTLTLACRPAPAGRPIGRASDVDDEVRREVRSRVPMWEAAGLALPDQLMASAGPAMEVVGRYSEVRNIKRVAIDPARYLVLARRVVEETAAIRIEDLPLETFDARTRFALFWARLFGRGVAAKSEARWQALASDLALTDLDGLLREADRGEGVRLAFGSEARPAVTEVSNVVDVALALAAAWPDGLAAVAQVLADAARDNADPHLWAALTYLSTRLPEGDVDRQSWMNIVRARKGIGNVTRDVVAVRKREDKERSDRDRQLSLFGADREGDL
jgi:putative DNA methylase